MILMFIGASPGSTGGETKITTAFILFLMLWNRIKGKEAVTAFNRTIPAETISKAIYLTFGSILAVILINSILLLLDSTVDLLIGRIGPFTVAYALSQRPNKKEVVYAEESPMVG